MTKYIDADWLLERAVPMGWSTPKWVSDIMIEDAPAADVVDKERYDILLEHANVLAEELRKYQNAKRNVEKFTDKEQRIFLAAMGREEKVCKQVDDECKYFTPPYDLSLVKVCKEITRKVKKALWT